MSNENKEIDLKDKLDLISTENKIYRSFVKRIAFSNNTTSVKGLALEVLNRVDHINKK